MKVREVLDRLRQEGWVLKRQKGSHRQFFHANFPERHVTVSGKPNLDIPKGTLNSIFKQASKLAGSESMKYAVVIEKSETGFGAYVPDLPGCVAVGDTIEEIDRLIREAIEFHVEGLREDGLSVPEPSAVAQYVEV